MRDVKASFAVVRDRVDHGHDAMRPHLQALLDAPDGAERLLRLARVLQTRILSPPVLNMRNLVAAEAERFPAVAVDYLARSWHRNRRLLSNALRELADRGALHVADPDVAAEQFTWLAIAATLNSLTLQASVQPEDDRHLGAIATEAVATFLSRFASIQSSTTSPECR